MSLPTEVDAFYQPLGEGIYQPTIHAQGAWSAQEQHMAPVSGLLAHALERHEPRPDLTLARISYDILGVIHAEPTAVKTQTLRPGRTIELVQAVASAGGRDVVRATAWRLTRHDTSAVAAVEDEPMPEPGYVPVVESMHHTWSGGYIASVEFRATEDSRPGRTRAWLRAPYDVVEGEESTDLATFMRLVDTANGIGGRQDPTMWMYPNTDLTVHFYRQPTGPWVGLDTSVSWGADGMGVTSTVLHDSRGPVGRAQQIQTVRRQP